MKGFADVEVLSGSGRRDVIRLARPSWRSARRLRLAFAKSHDPFCVIRACLPKGGREQKCLDQLTPESAENVENVAFALVFGERLAKRLLAVARTKIAPAT